MNKILRHSSYIVQKDKARMKTSWKYYIDLPDMRYRRKSQDLKMFQAGKRMDTTMKLLRIQCILHNKLCYLKNKRKQENYSIPASIGLHEADPPKE